MPGKPTCSGARQPQDAHSTPAQPPLSELSCSPQTTWPVWLSVSLHSSWSVRLARRECTAHPASMWRCWVAQRPIKHPSLQHLAILTSYLCGDSGTMIQAEGGSRGPSGSGVAQGLEVSWALPFHTRRLHFSQLPGLGISCTRPLVLK